MFGMPDENNNNQGNGGNDTPTNDTPKTAVVSPGTKVKDLVHNKPGVVVGSYKTELEPGVLIYSVQLKNGDVVHLRANQLEKR